MKLGVDLSCLSEHWAGFQYYTYNFVSNLLLAYPDPVFLLSFSDSVHLPPGTDRENVHLVRCSAPIHSRTTREQCLIPLLNEIYGRVDRLLIPAYLGPLFTSCDIDLIVHDLEFLENNHGLTYKNKFYWRGLYQKAFRSADRLFPCSRSTRDRLQELECIGTEKIGPVIYPGIRSLPASQYEHSEKSIDPYILYVGTISDRKNVDSLIEWYLNFSGGLGRQYDLRLVGSYGWGSIGKDRLNDPDHGIFWHGSVSDTELHFLYKNANVLCLPSYGEGFGMPILEAFDHDLPVVLSDISVFREVAGQAAWYISPNSIKKWYTVFEQALKNGKERQYKKMLGRRRLRQFRWADSVQKYLDTLQQ